MPLALGGHPRSEDYLWLQSWDRRWSARAKDRLERKLQVMICASKITLNAARNFVVAAPALMPRSAEIEAEEVVEQSVNLAAGIAREGHRAMQKAEEGFGALLQTQNVQQRVGSKRLW